MTDFLTTSDVADLLHVSPETVRLYARQERIPFETTPGGHRRYRRDAVLDALGRAGTPAISIGPSTLAAIPAGATQVNFDAPAITSPMATEVAALASQPRPAPRPVPSGPANRVHAALMTWAAPVELPVVGGRR
jgi:excisionase family DNA binding protein